MKSPAEYTAAILPERGHGSQTLVFVADVERLLTQVLADAAREKETYAHLLLRALRHNKPPTHV